jgi:putative ribosome biogenesis GTPase RsgA
MPADEERWRRFQPYKGLPALQEADATFFFGREDETAGILDGLARRPDRIITLIGQSGVGKSSLARAGVMARLKSQAWPLEAGA